MMLNKIIDVFYKFKNKTGIVIGDVQYTYVEIMNRVAILANQFKQYGDHQKPCIILSKKTINFFVSMIACFFSGVVYTPINITNSPEKIIAKINQLSDAFLFVGDIDPALLAEILSGIKNKKILYVNYHCYCISKNRFVENTSIYINEPVSNCQPLTSNYSDNLYAYLFFTSGSTGAPKAIPISYKNIDCYLKNICSVFHFSSEDRFIQLADIAFDIAIHEILVSFISGATLYVFDEKNEISVSHFIINNKITQCILVPSTIPVIVKQCQFYMHDLQSVERTLVCGEAFPIAYAENWQEISPKSKIVNLYGPTEATVCCMYHIYDAENKYEALKILPIGQPLGNVAVSLVQNELVIEGDQVSSGYWYVDDQRVSPFQFVSEKNTYAYHTGDCATFDSRWGYLFLGRRDDQWKIKGYRIEKNEIESSLRDALRADDLCVTPIFNDNQSISGLKIFSTCHIDSVQSKKILNTFFSTSLIIFEFHLLEEMPKLPNGKINYKKLSGLRCNNEH